MKFGTLSDVVRKKSLKATPQQYPDAKFIGMNSIEPHTLKPVTLYNFKEFKSSGNYFKKGEVLYGRMRPYLNKVCKAEFDGVCSGEFIVLECKDNFYPDFLKYILHSRQFVQFANSKTSGDRPRITFEEIVDYPIWVPPVELQQEIVSKIDELFSELDGSIEELKTAQKQLKVYRQAVLIWAFEGRLTNEDVRDGELPRGWEIKRLDDIGSWKGGGTPSKARKDFWENGEILWVSPKDMKSKVIHETIDKITREAVAGSTAQLIPKGSILFVVRSGILRRTLPVAVTVSPVTVNQDLKALIPTNVLADYIYYYVEAKNDDIRKTCSKDGTTVESIETSLLKNYQIPICSSEEQQMIVQEVESRLSVSDKIAETITNSLQQAEALRQSILKQAFEGRLISII